jgi:hypothetical protein
MYEFAVVALLGLATLKVVDLLVELVPGIERLRTLATFVLAIVAVLVLDYSVFRGFGIAVPEEWAGTLLTGIFAGSLASAWQALFGWLGRPEGLSGEGRRTDRPRIAA